MAVNINDLPVEVFSNILRRVRNYSTLPEVKDFVGLLTCCRYWKEVAQPILWRDVVLTNSNINTFISMVSPKTSGWIRSLTLRLTALKERWLDHRRGLWYWERESYYCRGIQALWHDLQNLAPTVGAMTKLHTFSLTVQPPRDFIGVDDFCLRVKDLTNLLNSLPLSCVNLEFDTCGFECLTIGPSEDYSTATHQHLCTTLAGLLPRLQHVRVQLKMICDSIFLEKHTPTPQSSLCDKKKSRYVSAPKLRSLVIGLYPENGLFDCSSELDYGYIEVVHRVANAAQDAYLACAFPSVTRLSTFHFMDGSSESEVYNLDYETIIKRDILRNETRRMPCLLVERKASAEIVADTEILLLGSDSQGNHKEIFGDFHEICRFLEGPVFQTTLSLSRLPAEFASSPAARAVGYQFHNFDKKMEVLDSTGRDFGHFEDLRITIGDYKDLLLRGKKMDGIADYGPYVEEGNPRWR